MKASQLVRFTEPQSDENPDQVYRIVEVNGDRCFIQPVGPEWERGIVPTILVLTEELTAN